MKKYKLTKKITVVTGSRADYGLLKNLMRLIQLDPEMILQIIATGSHLSTKHGLTINELEEDGFKVDYKLTVIVDHINSQSTSVAMGKIQSDISKILNDSKPDLMLVLGDRYEILSAVIAALLNKIPVAHIHGGEITAGTFDNSIRNAITKMSHLHFVATTNSEKRVIQMGEKPANVYNFGGLGVDAVKSINFLSKDEVEKALGIKFGAKNLLVTYHPETIFEKPPIVQIQTLLKALTGKNDIQFIFTGVNADPGSDEIYEAINKFVRSNPNSFYFPSLGQKIYFSTVMYCDGVLGNSSSGILEVPSLNKPTINIGDRQFGREMAASVVSCDLVTQDISNSIEKIFSKDFKESLKIATSPYGSAGASNKIYDVIKKYDLRNLVKKTFHDL